MTNAAALLCGCAVLLSGDKSKEFYIILSGEVEIRTPYPELEVITIKRKGEYFGFSGVVAGSHTLTATCSTEVLCLVLPERKKDKMLAGVKITTDPTKREIILGILGMSCRDQPLCCAVLYVALCSPETDAAVRVLCCRLGATQFPEIQ